MLSLRAPLLFSCYTVTPMYMLKTIYFKYCFVFLFAFPFFLGAQESVSLKTNLLGWSMGSVNLGVEIPLSSHLSVGVSGSYNPWRYTSQSKLQHLLVRPEVRYYPCRVYRKYFIGVQGVYGIFNAGGLSIPLLPAIKAHRYIGRLAGASIVGGYQIPLSKHWSFEASLSAGYIRTSGELYQLSQCRQALEKKRSNYVGPTDLALSFIYVFN